MAIKGTVFSEKLGSEVITSSIEHHAVLRACESIEKLGCSVKYLGVAPNGVITPESLEETITDRTKLVSIMLVNNEIGSLQPIKELGIDLLSASAHKFNGPKGVGFLYIRKGVSIDSYASGGAQEHGARAGTENVAGIVGMAKALEVNCRRMQASEIQLRKLEAIIIDALNIGKVDYIRNGDINHLPGNISLSFKDCNGEALLHRLDLMGIIVSTGSACDSVNTQVSHVIKAIGLDEKYALGTIRISLSQDNTEEDVKSIAEAILKIIRF